MTEGSTPPMLPRPSLPEFMRRRSAVTWVDLAGYIASSFVFLTFYMKDMVPLRVVALCSNLAFLIYAGALHLMPIFILHGALIPINARRLFCALRQRNTQAGETMPRI
jgi:hypothetical protein